MATTTPLTDRLADSAGLAYAMLVERAELVLDTQGQDAAFPHMVKAHRAGQSLQAGDYREVIRLAQ